MSYENPKESVVPSRSGLNEVVGGTAEQKADILHEFETDFNLNRERAEGDLRAGREIEKGENAKELIAYLSKGIPRFLERYGGKRLDLDESHIHLRPSDVFGKYKLSAVATRAIMQGKYDSSLQEISIRYDGPMDYYKLARIIAHEMVHFVSFQSVTAFKEKKGMASHLGRRMGLTIQGMDAYFDSLNEAVTEELAMRFLEAAARDVEAPRLLVQQVKQQEEFMVGIAEKAEAGMESDSRVREELILQSEIRDEDFEKMGTKKFMQHFFELVGDPEKKEYILEETAYPHQRLDLDRITEQVCLKHPRRFKNKEEVFALFAESAMSGKLLFLTRLIEDTYGRGAFRRLGEETSRFYREIDAKWINFSRLKELPDNESE